MHEVSLVSGIWRSLKENLRPEELDSLAKIKLKIGALSCVEPRQLETAYRMMVENTRFERVELEYRMVEAEAECAACGLAFKVENHRFICPRCSAPTDRITAGEEFLIESVEFTEATAPNPPANEPAH